MEKNKAKGRQDNIIAAFTSAAGPVDVLNSHARVVYKTAGMHNSVTVRGGQFRYLNLPRRSPKVDH